MTESVDPILEAAELATDTFTVLGKTFCVVQPSALQLIRRREHQFEDVATGEQGEDGKPKTRRQLRADSTERGIAYLISECVFREDGTKAYSFEQSLKIAAGAPGVAFPFINAVTNLIGNEKKSSPPKSDSGTA